MSRLGQLLALAGAAALGAAALSWSHGGDVSRVHVCTSGEGEPITLSSPNVLCRGRTAAGGTRTSLDWAIQGPKGDTGETGPAGKAAGPDVYKIVTSGQKKFFAKGTHRLTATCPQGYQVVNGGYKYAVSAGHDLDDSLFRMSAPDLGHNGWTIAVYSPIKAVVVLTAYAICYAPHAG